MRTVAVHFTVTIMLMLFACLCSPLRALPVTPPLDSLAGLTPGVSTLADAVNNWGSYDVAMPGEFALYAGGERVTKQFRWSAGITDGQTAIVAETPLCSPQIEAVVVNMYPGIATSRGLTTLVSENQVTTLYGIPDRVFRITLPNAPPYPGQNSCYLELYYVQCGLLVVMGEITDRQNWTVIKLLMTYPTYLRNAIAERTRLAMNTGRVADYTEGYRAWVRMAVPPA